jgi:LuxR family transcriptional regulator
MSNIAQIVCKATRENDKKLKRICEPLLQGFGLDTFWYYTLSSKGELTYVTNNVAIGEYFYSNEIFKGHPYFRDPSLLASGFFFSDIANDLEYTKTQGKVRDQFHLDQHFMIMQAQGEKLQGYGFATTKELPDLTNPIINNLYLFRKFISYFHDEAKEIIRQMDLCSVDISEHCKGHFNLPTAHFDKLVSPPNLDDFSKAMNDSKQIVLNSLTLREKECLRWLLKGMSAAQIGKKVHLSPRTVEFYLTNVKNKLGCSTKQELFSSLLEWNGFLQSTFF